MWTRFARARFLIVMGCVSIGLTGCSRDGDPPADVGEPSALGRTTPLHVLQDPDNKDHLKIDPPATCAVPFSAPLTVNGVTVNWVDRYDETGNGDVGTVWIQDFKSQAPWSGSSIFSPSFVPASLYVAEGDVIDLRGLYQVNVCIGAKVDFQKNGGVLSQIATPVSTFRFEGPPSEPVDVPVTDFDSFATGRKWLGMLVRFQNVNVDSVDSNKGRTTVTLLEANKIFLSNEFQSLDSMKKGQTYTSVTGVVTWFFDFKLATRTPEDLVLAP